MIRTLAAAAAFSCLSLAIAAPASADEGFYERNGADRAVSGLGNGNGNSFVPTVADDDGVTAGDAAIGALAGVLLAGGVAGAITVSRRRRGGHVAHPA